MKAAEGLRFREGRVSDLRPVFELSEHALTEAARRHGLVPSGSGPDGAELEKRWRTQRPFLEFITAQPQSRFLLCEDEDEGTVGYVRVSRFGEMEEMTELMVRPSHHSRGIGRRLLEQCWPEPPTPDLGRVVVTVGTPVDLSLYTEFGVMPVAGHWHMTHRLGEYLERRSLEIDANEPGVHALTVDRAVQEWKRLEPSAVGHERPLLHEFFGRARACLATIDAGSGQANGLCWVSQDGEIGPAVAESAELLVPVVLAALDRVAKAREPETLSVYCTTDSWWLLDRLRRLGFRVYWPSWVLSSVPLPGLDRYLPTWPAWLL